MLDSFKSPSATCTSKSVLLDVGDDDSDDMPTVQEEKLSPETVPACHFIFCTFFVSIDI